MMHGTQQQTIIALIQRRGLPTRRMNNMSGNWIFEICEEIEDLRILCPEKSVMQIAIDLCDAYSIGRWWVMKICAKYAEIQW